MSDELSAQLQYFLKPVVDPPYMLKIIEETLDEARKAELASASMEYIKGQLHGQVAFVEKMQKIMSAKGRA